MDAVNVKQGMLAKMAKRNYIDETEFRTGFLFWFVFLYGGRSVSTLR